MVLMKNKPITLKHKNKKYLLLVKECNFLEKILGLMVFRKDALLLFNSSKPHKYKIHSLFCNPFTAIYTDDKFNVKEIIEINKWKTMILPREKFYKLIEIPKNKKYKNIIKAILK